MLTDPIFLPLWIYMGFMYVCATLIVLALGVRQNARRKKEEVARQSFGEN